MFDISLNATYENKIKQRNTTIQIIPSLIEKIEFLKDPNDNIHHLETIDNKVEIKAEQKSKVYVGQQISLKFQLFDRFNNLINGHMNISEKQLKRFVFIEHQFNQEVKTKFEVRGNEYFIMFTTFKPGRLTINSTLLESNVQLYLNVSTDLSAKPSMMNSFIWLSQNQLKVTNLIDIKVSLLDDYGNSLGTS